MRQWIVAVLLISALLIGAWGAWDTYQRQVLSLTTLQDHLTQQHLQIAQLNDRLVALDRQQRQQPAVTETATQLSVQSTRQSVLLLLQFAQQHLDHAQLPQALAQLQQLEQQLATGTLDPMEREALRQVIQSDIAALKQRDQQQQQAWRLQDHAIARLQDLIQYNAQTLPRAQAPALAAQTSWQEHLQGWVSIRAAQPTLWMELHQRTFLCYQTLILLGQIRSTLPTQQLDTLSRLWLAVDVQLAQLPDGHSVHARQLARQLAQIAPPARYQLQSLQLWQTDRGASP